MLTQSRLRELLNYNPETGEFRWIIHRAGVHKGIAGTLVHGHRAIVVDGKPYYAHRLAFLYMTGDWPQDQVDHINRIRDDNRWSNLRPATRSENMRNARVRKTSTSGIKGVSFHSKAKKWEAFVWLDKKKFYLGLFDTKDDAARERNSAAQKHHGEFAYDGAA